MPDSARSRLTSDAHQSARLALFLLVVAPRSCSSTQQPDSLFGEDPAS